MKFQVLLSATLTGVSDLINDTNSIYQLPHILDLVRLNVSGRVCSKLGALT